jgi:hypothetical protein
MPRRINKCMGLKNSKPTAKREVIGISSFLDVQNSNGGRFEKLESAVCEIPKSLPYLTSIAMLDKRRQAERDYGAPNAGMTRSPFGGKSRKNVLEGPEQRLPGGLSNLLDKGIITHNFSRRQGNGNHFLFFFQRAARHNGMDRVMRR